MEVLLETLVERAKSYLPGLNEKRLRKAFRFAKRAHSGQLRKDGSPYVTHPLAAAIILTNMHVDADTLIACLLHDVPEDTDYTLEDIEKRFGKKVCFLVNGITKLSKVHYRNSMEERQIESLKKLFIHCAQDPRIILIKLADRLHNMKTLEAIDKPEKRKRIAKETLEVYVPIANLLGIWELKSQLEDCCFKTLYPEQFNKIDELAKESALRRKDVLIKTVKNIKTLLKKAGINGFKIEGRKKSYYSIYQKMVHDGKSFQEIYDLIGLRVILDNVNQCYQALGIFHQNFTPKPGRLKDYIAIPKSNGYQSIHTTVFGVGGTLTEVQIRTKAMDLESTYGVAAHYFYAAKRKRGSVKKELQSKSQWVQRILDIQRDMENNKKFMDQLKLDVFEDRIFVFTPKGDVVDLPRGSRVLDFAYNIHSDIGNKASSAFINGSPVKLHKELKSGDVIFIVASEENQGPKLEWLNMVKTNNAKNKIREYLKRMDRERITNGAEMHFNQKLRSYGHKEDFLNVAQREWLASVFEQESWESLMYAVGNGSIEVGDVIGLLQLERNLIGEFQDPENVHVYDHVLNRLPNALSPTKVYLVRIMIECTNRVGLLRDTSLELANLNVNIVKTMSWHSPDAKMSTLEYTVEIRDIEQYDLVVYRLSQIPDVIQVSRVQSAEPVQLNPDGSRIKREQ